jgi:hypothetical protein
MVISGTIGPGTCHNPFDGTDEVEGQGRADQDPLALTEHIW